MLSSDMVSPPLNVPLKNGRPFRAVLQPIRMQVVEQRAPSDRNSTALPGSTLPEAQLAGGAPSGASFLSTQELRRRSRSQVRPGFWVGRQRLVAWFDRDLTWVMNLPPTWAALDVLTRPVRGFAWFLKRHLRFSPNLCSSCRASAREPSLRRSWLPSWCPCQRGPSPLCWQPSATSCACAPSVNPPTVANRAKMSDYRAVRLLPIPYQLRVTTVADRHVVRQVPWRTQQRTDGGAS